MLFFLSKFGKLYYQNTPFLDTMASSVAASLMGSSMASSVPPAVEEVSEEGLPIITLEEVKNHFSRQDAWMVVYDRVYNVTSFLAEVCTG